MPANNFQRLGPENFDYDQVGRRVGVFLRGKGVPDHVGLFFVAPETIDEDGNKVPRHTREFHFVTNNKIINERLTSGRQYLHSPIGFDDVNGVLFSSWLFETSLNKSQIRYGVDWHACVGSFDELGNYTKGAGEAGLTCATFVSELLAAFGHAAISVENWPANSDEDKNWLTKLVKGYRERLAAGATTLTEEQIDEMEATDPVVRLHPVQIAATAATPFEGWKELTHAEILVLAEEVQATFAAAFDAPAP